MGTKTGTGTRFRLGFGDMMLAGPNPYARWLFLQAISLHVPQALEELVAIDYADDAHLCAWGLSRGFTDGWALQIARTNAERWREDPESRWHWSGVTVAAWSPVIPPPPVPRPTMETKAAYLQRVDDYATAVWSAPGLIRTPEKRGNLEHFEWLALHQVGRLTYHAIAIRYQDAAGNPNESAISRAVKETADIIGLTPRPARGRKLPDQPSK